MPNMDPNLFSVVWSVWHTLAENIDWTPRRRRKFLTFISTHAVLLPCNGCRDHLRKNLETVLSPEGIAKFMTVEVSDWLYEFHRTVTLQIAERTYVRIHGTNGLEQARAVDFGRKLMTRDAVELMYSFKTKVDPMELGLLFYLMTQSDEFRDDAFAAAVGSFRKIIEGTSVMSAQDFETALRLSRG